MDSASREQRKSNPSRPPQDSRPAPHEPEPETFRVEIPPDRIDPEAVKVVRRLSRHGHTAYLVGGGVRDLLLDRQPKDFDIATSARPQQVRRLFRNCRLIGRRFRLAHILFSAGKIIEVATFRREAMPTEPPPGNSGKSGQPGSRDGAETGADDASEQKDKAPDLLIRRDNTYGEPHEDAARRDFTINGLFYDLERQEVIDYVGGLSDLRKGVVRTIGRADVRFREDPIRILRAVRFGARLDMGIAPEVQLAMVDQRRELERSAPPRLLEEVLRLMRGGAAQRSIHLAWELGALGVLLPELTACLEAQHSDPDLLWARLSAVDGMFREERLPTDAVLFAALLYDPMQQAVESAGDASTALREFFPTLTERFALPRKMKDRMQRIFSVQRRLHQGKLGALVQRDFFPEAVALFELRCRAEGTEVAQWVPRGGLAKKRKATRRRRRRQKTASAASPKPS